MFVHVCLQIAVLGEGLWTNFALVRLVVAVNQHVTLKMTIANKRR